jgi:hypothetical protein
MDDEILSVDDAAGLLQIPPAKVVELLMSSDLAGRNVGGRWLTTKRALVTFVDGLSTQGGCCGPGMCCVPNAAMATPANKVASGHSDS